MLPLMKYITVHSVRQMLHSAMLPARAHYLYTDASPSGTPSRLNIVKTAVGVHDKILKMCLDKGEHYNRDTGALNLDHYMNTTILLTQSHF